MRRLATIALVAFVPALATLALAQRALAQGAPAPTQLSASTMDRIRGRGLDSLIRPPVRTFYSAGAHEHARRLASLVGDMLRFYSYPDSGAAFIDLAVLGTADWSAVGGGPYGLPGIRSPAVVLMPAEHEKAFVYRHILSARDSLSRELRQRLQAACVRYESCATEVLDLVVLHEVGHLLEMRAPIGRPTAWFGEFLAWYFAYAFLAESHPALAARVRLIHEALAAGISPMVPTLAAFESHLRDPRTFPGSPEEGLREYARLQGLMVERAVAAHTAAGAGLATGLAAAFPRRSTAPECANNRVCTAHERTSAEVAARLEALVPGFRAWADSIGSRR